MPIGKSGTNVINVDGYKLTGTVLTAAGVSAEVGEVSAMGNADAGVGTEGLAKVHNAEEMGARVSAEQQGSLKMLSSTSSVTSGGFRRPKVIFLSLLCIATIVSILCSEISPLAKRPEGILKEKPSEGANKAKQTKAPGSGRQAKTGGGKSVCQTPYQTAGDSLVEGAA
ncbi:hypothetical protein, conserved [Eimeria brunetti]|uniref:Uncharacterized protein n=1 Tax=Eimeria brunetti TaxID=51314 RepID=U6LQ91_9EIME|nr:hypothetical protein, conserved [Eimeria brunetti]